MTNTKRIVQHFNSKKATLKEKLPKIHVEPLTQKELELMKTMDMADITEYFIGGGHKQFLQEENNQMKLEEYKNQIKTYLEENANYSSQVIKDLLEENKEKLPIYLKNGMSVKGTADLIISEL